MEHKINVVRRLSGGGAVYHDLGNLNFTFIANAGEGATFDFATFCQPLVKALAKIGVTAEINGRNDMTIDGKKFSGNSQYIKQRRIMQHGTLMFNSDLSVVAGALAVSADKIESKGLKSVRSRITNIIDYMPDPLPMLSFKQSLLDNIFDVQELEHYYLSEDDMEKIRRIQSEVYDRWDWNYGASPTYDLVKKRRIEGVGSIEVHMNVTDGIIQKLAFYGDYFGSGDSTELARLLELHRAEEFELRDVLSQVDVGFYFANMYKNDLLAVLLQ